MESNPKSRLSKERIIGMKAEHWIIMHRINQNSSEELTKNMQKKEIFLWQIKDDFENKKETFIPVKDKE